MRGHVLRQTLIPVLAVMLGLSLLFSGCGRKEEPQTPSSEPASKAEEALSVSGLAIMHETEFGGVYLDLTIDEFNELGFQYGDSLAIRFSNGYVMEDIPYYNGYYTRYKDPLLVAYPGYPHIRAGINNGDDLWVVADLKEEDTADVVLLEHAKYLEIQEARDIHYSDEREKFPSDEVFANFRALTGGRLKENLIYRSASPADDQHSRAPYADELIKKAGVRFIVNLADNEEKIAGYLADPDFHSPYFLSLYEEGNVVLLSMNTLYDSDGFKEKAAKACRAMLQSEGPYLIHCTEGKDRTGFMCLLIEALAGASYEEILSDYMITYDNYYQISPMQQTDKYETIISEVLDPMIEMMMGETGADLKSADLSEYARRYLAAGNMTDEEIAEFIARITK